MKFITYEHRHALTILNSKEYLYIWGEIHNILNGITEEEIMKEFLNGGDKRGKSISKSLNTIIKSKLVGKNWQIESPIFKEKDYLDDTWRLDFAKESISIEVGFNHGSVVAWNLLKPVLASELNHVEKAIQTQIAIVITATNQLKKTGGFDNAVGSYEKYIQYLKPLNMQLTVPTLIIGLEGLEKYYISHEKDPITNKKIGIVNKVIV